MMKDENPFRNKVVDTLFGEFDPFTQFVYRQIFRLALFLLFHLVYLPRISHLLGRPPKKDIKEREKEGKDAFPAGDCHGIAQNEEN
jgi:hypothetical protein